MAKKTLELIGISEYRGNVNKLIKKSHKELGISLKTTTLNILKETIQNTPVSPGGGRLKAGWTFEIDEKGLEAIVFNEVEYAAYVELGTKKMSAQPHLQPAVYGNIGNWTAEVQRAIDKATADALRKFL